MSKSESSSEVDFSKMLSKDALLYVPVKVVPAVAGLATIVILTRRLNPVQYGTYSAVLTTVLLLSQLFGTWLSNAVFFLFPNYQGDQAREFQRRAIRLQAAAAAPAALIALLWVRLLTGDLRLASVASLLVVLQLFQSLFATFFQAKRQVAGQIASVMAQVLSQFLLLVALVFLLNGAELSALLAVANGYLACLVVMIVQERRVLRRVPGGTLEDGDLFMKLVSYGLPMCIWFFSTQFYTVGDRILLKLMGVAEGIGQYASFRDLSTGAAGFLTMPLLMASHPIIMMMHKQGRERSQIERVISRNISVLVLLFVPLLALMDLLGVELIRVMLGERYLVDKPVMLLVIGSIFLGCVSIYAQKGLEVTGKTRKMAGNAVITLGFSLACNLFAIRWWGVRGSASVGFASQVLYLGLTLRAVRNLLPVRFSAPLAAKAALWVVALEAVFAVFPWDLFGTALLLTGAKLAVFACAVAALYSVTGATDALLARIGPRFSRSAA